MTPTGIAHIHNIGFISTRVYGTDGVSLEIDKWADVLERMGFRCFYFCGKSDRPADRSFIVDEADFLHDAIREIYRQAFGGQHRSRVLTREIQRVSSNLKDKLYEAIDQFQLDLLIAQNSLTIPLNIPLGDALVQLLIETGIPCIAHHHDFIWERDRFLVNAVDDYLHAAFPPRLAEIEHVVINTLAGEEFSRRTGLSYRIIPNVMDFANPPDPPDDYASDFRETIGVDENDILILQPTRVVRRKGIEHTIELVRRLNDSRCKLVITHSAGDEEDPYLERIKDFAELMDVKLIFADRWISAHRNTNDDGQKQYAIWDVYPQADLVAYPSTYEGFGNAFLEAAYYRKPILCNRYTIFRTDIVMGGYLTDQVVEEVRRVLHDDDYRLAMVKHNYDAANQFFSYERLRQELQSILAKPRPCGSEANANS